MGVLVEIQCCFSILENPLTGIFRMVVIPSSIKTTYCIPLVLQLYLVKPGFLIRFFSLYIVRFSIRLLHF